MKLFDLDGTLIDSNHIWLDVDVEFLARRGKEPTEEYTEYVAHAIFPTAARFTRDYYGLDESTDEIMADWLDLAHDAYASRAPLKPGVLDYLEQCRAQGEELALFTASVPALGRLAVERHGLERYFSTLVFAQDLGLEKRRPESFRAALGRLGADAEQCTMFDDSPRNCASAKAAGLTVVGVYDDFFAPVQAQVRENSHAYIRSFEELLGR